MASRKLGHYFEAHRIIAISDQPLHDLLHNREASPRIAKWASELSELVVDFEKRTTIKSQALADFTVDWTSPEAREEELTETWTIHCDGAWQNEGVGIAAILESPSGAKIRYAARLNFDQSAPSTNNTTEYEALLLGLRKMKALGHQNCIVKTDSKVIADHIEKESEARKPELIQYLEAARAMEKHSGASQSPTSLAPRMTKPTGSQRQWPESSNFHQMFSSKKSLHLRPGQRRKPESTQSLAKIGGHQ